MATAMEQTTLHFNMFGMFIRVGMLIMFGMFSMRVYVVGWSTMMETS